MTERYPSTTTIDPETKTTVDPETIAEIDSIETKEDERVPSRLAERIRVTVERVTTFLDRRAINKAHGEALREDLSRGLGSEGEEPLSSEYAEDDELGDDDYDDVDEEELAAEVAARAEARGTESEAKERKKGRTKAVLRKIGFFAIEKLEANGFVPLMSTWQKRGGVRGRIADAYVARNNKDKRISTRSGADGGSEGETRPSAEAEENVEEDVEDDEETLPEEPEVDTRIEGAREHATEKARRARESKAGRKERTPLRERATSMWQKLMGGRRKIGARALAFATRVRASAGAAREAWENFDR
jgi:hypothetical protein